MNTMMIENGSAVAKEAAWSPSSPPANNRPMAIAPSSPENITRDQVGGLGWPPAVSMFMTREPESDEVMKNSTTSSTPMMENTVPKGRSCRTVNREPSGETSLSTTRSASPNNCRWIPEPPRTPNHSMPTRVGTNMTPIINSRMVLPRETRAMKIPTNGAQAIHQPQ